VSRGNFTFTWNGDAVAQDVKAAMRDGLANGSDVLARQMRNTLNTVGPSAPGAPPGTDKRTLRNSIAYNLTSDTTSRVGTNVPYGKHLEYGFTARAKGKGGLPVPLNKEARKMLRDAAVSKTSLRNVGHGLVFIKRRGKPPLLVKTSGKGTRGGKSWIPMFVLKKSVTVAPRPWVLRSFEMAKAGINTAIIKGTERALAARIASRANAGGRAA
jgi:hypothetical protein